MKKSSRQAGPGVGDRAALHVLAPVARADRHLGYVLVVEVASVVDLDGERAVITGDARRQHHVARRVAVVVVADMDDEVGAEPLLVLGDDAERPDLGEAVAGAGLRLVGEIAAAAAVAHHQHAARRGDGHGRQLQPPVTDQHGGGFAHRVERLADQHVLETPVGRALARRHALPGTGSTLQQRTRRRPFDDGARHRHGLAVGPFAPQDEGKGCRLRARRGRQAEEDDKEQGAAHDGLRG